MLEPYPPGRWRLVPRSQLGPVRIWASHILIRHRGVVLGSVPFFGPLEPVGARSVERTRAEARALAEHIASEVRSRPQRFAELARQYSEDRVSSSTDGSLGALHGLALLPFPQVLDAFAVLKVGEVSQVIETEHGFHVFRLRVPPPDRTFNAAHIVIAHDEAPWLRENLARDVPPPQRSRAEALALAGTLYERALAAPLEFGSLAAESSEHIDAVHGGDLGAWSTRDPGANGRQLELLLELPVYGVARPIDSVYGVEVLQRTPDRARAQVAMQGIRLPFDPAAAPSEQGSKSDVLRLATAIARDVSTQPERFAVLQADYCCAGQSMRWTEHQEPTKLAFATERLGLGEISREPIEFASSYVIAKRIDPASLPPESPIRFELPEPSAGD